MSPTSRPKNISVTSRAIRRPIRFSLIPRLHVNLHLHAFDSRVENEVENDGGQIVEVVRKLKKEKRNAKHEVYNFFYRCLMLVLN